RSFSILLLPPLTPTFFPYTTLFRSSPQVCRAAASGGSRDRPQARAHAHVAHGNRGALSQASDQHSCPGGGDLSVSAREPRHRARSEEHTSELQSRFDLVCRLLLEKK